MSFSWKKGLIHAGIAVGVMVGVGAAVAGAGLVKDPEKFGEGAGQFVVFLALAALGVSWLVQTGRKRTALGVVLGGVGLIGALVGAVVLSAHRAEPLSKAEKAPLVLDGGRLVHPVLGFSLVHPGDKFKEAPSTLLTASFPKDMDVHGYLYADQDDGRVLMILESSEAPRSKKDFEDMLRGMRRGLEPAAKLLANGGELKTLTDESTWRGDVGESHMHMQGGAAHLRLDAWRRDFGRKPRLVVVVGMTGDGDTLADVLASFRG